LTHPYFSLSLSLEKLSHKIILMGDLMYIVLKKCQGCLAI